MSHFRDPEVERLLREHFDADRVERRIPPPFQARPAATAAGTKRQRYHPWLTPLLAAVCTRR